jgi:hypothetical protein
MYEPESRTRSESSDVGAGYDRVGPDWAEQATTARQREWSSDRVVDQGDTHDKGEASLCVGEAA